MKPSMEFVDVATLGVGVFVLTWAGWYLGGVLLAMSGFFLALGIAFLVLDFEHLNQYEPKEERRIRAPAGAEKIPPDPL